MHEKNSFKSRFEKFYGSIDTLFIDFIEVQRRSIIIITRGFEERRIVWIRPSGSHALNIPITTRPLLDGLIHSDKSFVFTMDWQICVVKL